MQVWRLFFLQKILQHSSFDFIIIWFHFAMSRISELLFLSKKLSEFFFDFFFFIIWLYFSVKPCLKLFPLKNSICPLYCYSTVLHFSSNVFRNAVFPKKVVNSHSPLFHAWLSGSIAWLSGWNSLKICFPVKIFPVIHPFSSIFLTLCWFGRIYSSCKMYVLKFTFFHVKG